MSRLSDAKAGLIALIVIVVITFFGFTKANPFSQPFEVNAVFESAVSIRTDAPVRVAGVDVGRVAQVRRFEETDLAELVLEMDKEGLPIHKDATMKIRPRIFLEGNFFVDLQPGTPSSPVIDDGDTIPVTQTSIPVQLDQVLTALQSDTREDLKALLDGLGEGLTREPSEEDDADADPDVRGKTGAESLNDSLRYSADAFRTTAQVNQALLGTEPRDLSRLIRGLGRVSRALGRNEAQLQDLITNFNTTMGALAAEESGLRATLRGLPPVLEQANTTLASLNEAFPPTRAFAREILPGVRETAETIDAAFPWISQTRRLLGPDELRGLAREARPTVASLARLTDESIGTLPQLDLVNRCLSEIVLPTGDVRIIDPPFTTGEENYKELFYALVGISGEGQNQDGNGMYVRFQTGGGSQQVSTGTVGGQAGSEQLGSALRTPVGTRPRYPGRRPPYRPDVPCHTNRRPDLNGPAAAPGPADRVVGENPPGALTNIGEPPSLDAPGGVEVPEVLGALGKRDEGEPGAEGQARAGAGEKRGDGEARSQGGGEPEAGGKPEPSVTEKLAARLNPFAAAGREGSK
jgi:phospholipid/cholesterol/gamma-HCH transport system substrate-binding protein